MINYLRNKKNIALLILLLIVFILIFVLNNRTLYISDDFLYKFEFIPGMPNEEVIPNIRPINGFVSVFKSQYHHYSLWNGRFVSHTLIQFFMQFDKLFFNIFNTFMYLLLGITISKINRYITDQSGSVPTLVLIYILLFLSLPSFGQTVLWISGAGNYLWMSNIYLAFYYYNLKSREDNWKSISIAASLGFIAGATNENAGPAVILMVIFLMIYNSYQKKEIIYWRIIGIVSSVIGFSIILFSPAAAKRASEKNEVSFTILNIIENAKNITKYMLENYLVYFIMIIITFLFLYVNKKLSNKILIHIFILSIGFLGATYSLAVVNRIIGRTMFGSIILLIIITSVLISLSMKYINNQKIVNLSLLLLTLFFIQTYRHAFMDINYTYNEVVQQYEIIYSNPNKHVRVPMIEAPKTDYNAYNNGTNYLKENNDAWLNKWAAKFFGVKSIEGYK